MKNPKMTFTTLGEVPEGSTLHKFMHMESRDKAAIAVDQWVSDMLREACLSPQDKDALSAFVSAYIAVVGDPLGKALACGNIPLTGELLQRITEEIGRMLTALLHNVIPMYRADLDAFKASHGMH